MVLRRLPTRGTFRSLRVRNFRLFLIGSVAPKAGIWMQRVAQDWLVLQLSGSGIALGIATALQFLPTLCVGMWGGALVDRANRRRVLLATQAAQAVLALGLGLVTVTGLVNLWLVYLQALLLGAVTVVDSPARQALLGEMVQRDDVRNAQALYSATHNIGRLAGSAVAGIVVAASGAGVVFLIAGATFTTLLAGLSWMDAAQLHRAPRHRGARREVREGLRYIYRRPELRLAIALAAIVAVFGQNYRVVLPLLAEQTFGGNAQTYGYLTATLGFGAIAGSLISAGGSRPTGRSLLVTCAAFGAMNLLVAAAPVLALALAGMAALGFASLLFNTVARSALLLGSGQRLHGRVMALFGIVFLGGKALGGPLVGWLCTLWGAQAGLAMAGGVPIITALALAPALGRSGNRADRQRDRSETRQGLR